MQGGVVTRSLLVEKKGRKSEEGGNQSERVYGRWVAREREGADDYEQRKREKRKEKREKDERTRDPR